MTFQFSKCLAKKVSRGSYHPQTFEYNQTRVKLLPDIHWVPVELIVSSIVCKA